MSTHYLGRWDKIGVPEGDDTVTIEVSRIDAQRRLAFTTNGTVIPLETLEADYEKLEPEYMDPEKLNELRAMINGDLRSEVKSSAAKQPITEDIVGTGKMSSIIVPSSTVPSFVPSSTVPSFGQEGVLNSAPTPTNELEQFVKQAIELSKKKKETSELPISINIKFDFDILKVVGGCATLTTGSDEDILKAIFKFNPVNQSAIIEAIIKELLSPTDYEEEFDKTLDEELNKK